MKKLSTSIHLSLLPDCGLSCLTLLLPFLAVMDRALKPRASTKPVQIHKFNFVRHFVTRQITNVIASLVHPALLLRYVGLSFKILAFQHAWVLPDRTCCVPDPPY